MDSIIESKIVFVRGKKVMLDRDLAELYEVDTKRLNEQVRRNIARFPEDFMFKLTKKEILELSDKPGLRSQIATSSEKTRLNKAGLIFDSGISSSKHGGQRYLPYAFTEQGVAMLSSVLRSERAILVNIQIMRTFTKLRELLSSNKELRDKIEQLESKYDSQFKVVFEAIRKLLLPTKPPREEPKPKIGFRVD